MPITPEQAIALTEEENKLLQSLYMEIDQKLSATYDYDQQVEIILPAKMRETVIQVIRTVYKAAGWELYDDFCDSTSNTTLTFSSNLTRTVIPYNKPLGIYR